MDAKPKGYGLIGQKLGHSFSKNFFTEKFEYQEINAVYENFECASIDDVAILLSTTDIHCFNVTIPYKQSIMPFIKEVDAAAARIGAVNCILKVNDVWHGTNTDWKGFLYSLKEQIEPKHKKALILGDGGAAKAVQYALRVMNIPFINVTRKQTLGSIHYSDLNEKILQEYTLVINCTPLGTWPNINDCPPIPYEFISINHLCFDLVYNPEQTQFMKMAQAQGALVCNGLHMLHAQAEAAWVWWGESY
jgi:shikimate dehydrogenase